MTGLTASTSEQLVIQNYGIAGHYKLHWDHATENSEDFDLGTGNRIATLLLYVSLFLF